MYSLNSIHAVSTSLNKYILKCHDLLQTIRPQQVLFFESLIRWQPTLTAGQFSWQTILALKQTHILQALGSVSNSPCLYFLPLDTHQTADVINKIKKINAYAVRRPEVIVDKLFLKLIVEKNLLSSNSTLLIIVFDDIILGGLYPEI